MTQAVVSFVDLHAIKEGSDMLVVHSIRTDMIPCYRLYSIVGRHVWGILCICMCAYMCKCVILRGVGLRLRNESVALSSLAS